LPDVRIDGRDGALERTRRKDTDGSHACHVTD